VFALEVGMAGLLGEKIGTLDGLTLKRSDCTPLSESRL